MPSLRKRERLRTSASGTDLRRPEKRDQRFGCRLWRLFGEIMPAVDGKTLHVDGPFAPGRERIVGLGRDAAGATPDRQHRTGDFLGRGARLLVVGEIGGATGAVVLASGVNADGVVEERMVMRKRARVEGREALDLGSCRRACIEKEQRVLADHGLWKRSRQRQEHPVPGTVGEPGVHAAPHSPGWYDVEGGEPGESSGVIEREPIGNAAAAIVAGEAEMHVAQRL